MTSTDNENDEKLDLSLSATWLKRDSQLSILYPPLPDDYFEGKDVDELLKRPSTNPIDTIVDTYNNLPVKPYIRRRDLNAGDESAKSKHAWEIGIKFDF